MTTTTTNPITDLALIGGVIDAAQNVQAFGDAMRAAFFERDAEVTALLVALVAKEHLLLLGPPGTAKSAIVQAFVAALKGSQTRYFEYLMTRYTVPDELFGVVDVMAFKQGKYQRMIAGMLPEAHVAFLDEIFKANSAILNALLTLTNERAFDMGGRRIQCPLEIVVGASNELPEEGQGLGALYDRFVLRRWVEYIRSDDDFEALWDMQDAPSVTVDLDLADIAVLRDAVRKVDTSAIKDAILELRRELPKQHGIVISDRRWRKAKKLIQAHALINGRMTAIAEDVLILADALWEKPEERAAIYGLIASLAAPDLAEALRMFDAAQEAYNRVDFSDESPAAVQTLATANQALKTLVGQLRALDQSGPVAKHTAQVVDWQNKVARAAMTRLGF